MFIQKGGHVWSPFSFQQSISCILMHLDLDFLFLGLLGFWQIDG